MKITEVIVFYNQAIVYEYFFEKPMHARTQTRIYHIISSKYRSDTLINGIKTIPLSLYNAIDNYTSL